jgi:SAM-dependent methyltransferase
MPLPTCAPENLGPLHSAVTIATGLSAEIDPRQSEREGSAMPISNTAAAANFQNPDAYEQVMGRWSRRLAPLLIQFGGLSDGDRVLDVGCGTGSLTFTFPEIANVASVTGIDLTEPYVEFARARNADPRISFQQADARTLPFEDNSFDRAFSMLVLHSSPMRPAQWPRCVVLCAPEAL